MGQQFRADYPELLYPGLKTVYGSVYDEYPEEFSQVFQIETSDKAYEKEFEVSGFGLTAEKAEGQPLGYDAMGRGNMKVYTHLTYAKGFKVSQEMWEDELYNVMKGYAQALGFSNRQSMEILAASILNNAFDSTYKHSDGLALCSSVHTLPGGGTMSNQLDTPADLDITSYEAALNQLTNYVNGAGLKIKVMPKKLIVGSRQVEFKANQILKSAQLPGTPNNDINPVQGTMPGGVMLMHFLNDPKAWFIQTNIMNGLKWFWRRPAQFAKDNDWDGENAKFKTTYRCSAGATDMRCLLGSAGSGR